MPFQIGLLLFPDVTQLDMTGPYEVFIKFPDAKVHLLWKTLDPVAAAGGMRLLPSTTLADSPQLDLVCVPGGAGMNALLNDEEVLDFLRRQASGARYITSVCTGSLVLGAAGLLQESCHPTPLRQVVSSAFTSLESAWPGRPLSGLHLPPRQPAQWPSRPARPSRP